MRFAILPLLLLAQEPEKAKEFKVENVLGLGATVLKEEGKTRHWRLELGNQMDAFLKVLGEVPDPKVLAHAPKMRVSCLDETRPLVTKNQDEINESAAVIAKAKGKEIERRSVLVCESADYESIKECIVICSGDLKVKKMERAIVFAKGNVSIGRRADGCVIIAGGKITSDDEIEESTLLAEGGVEIKNDSDGNVYVNTPNRKVGTNKKGDDKDVIIPTLPGKREK
jgi:hypothetical protein